MMLAAPITPKPVQDGPIVSGLYKLQIFALNKVTGPNTFG